jgi:hypothetical protein
MHTHYPVPSNRKVNKELERTRRFEMNLYSCGSLEGNEQKALMDAHRIGCKA